ncbi:DNA-directed RNA polymerase III subunit RPC5-like [Asterias rubens]|uniref:DNA-directed RNA polymerase III subunit RPC5-like n=1 Tax=Asterias rubens TaxID=7604 RepID=UPI001455B594|nr:DNA-directed RNA polymerase III subunit RPC5-like [Asterias rubens]
MSDTDDDPVVEEVDVYLSKSLAENLYLFQYPVRPSGMPYDDFQHLVARVKPKQKMVELEIGLDTQNSNYDKSRGEQISINVDGANPIGNQTFQSDVMDKQVLASSSGMASTSRYAVGILKDGELHLTPLHGLAQLRPNFAYLDKADLKSKVDKADNEGESSQEEEEEAKPVKVQFARPESDQAKARRLASYSHHEKMLSEEMWVPLSCQSINDQRSYAEREKLFCQATESEVSQLNLPPRDYLAMLVPEAMEDEAEKPKLPSNVLSMNNLKTMNLSDQVKALLINAKALRFTQLLGILPGTPDPIAVLRAVQQVAMLVQGCWVVKSDVLYPKDSTSPISGVPADILCRGRDYVMWRFNQSRCIVRKEMASITKLPSEDMKSILEQMARPKVNRGWEFAIEFDSEFVMHHEEVTQRQHMLWDAKYQQLSKVLKVPKHDAEKKSKGKDTKDSSQPVEVMSGQERVKVARNRARTKSLTQHTPQDNAEHKTPNSNASLRTDSGDGSSTRNNTEPGDGPSTRVSTEPGDAALTRIKTEPEESPPEPMDVSPSGEESLRGGAANAGGDNNSLQNGPNLENGSSVDDDRKELTALLRDKFVTNYVMSLSEMRQHIMARLSERPAGHREGTPTDAMLEQCAVDVGATLLHIPWPSNSLIEDKKIFGLCETGDSLDKFRAVIFDMFREGFKYRRNQFSERFKEVLGKEPASRVEFDRLIKSLCLYKAQFWYLKGTLPT